VRATTSQVIEIFGVSLRAVQNWITEGLPILEAGGEGRAHEHVFDTVVVHRWIRDRAVARVQREMPDGKLKQLQAEKLAIELEREAGKLVYAADIETLLVDSILAARTELMNLADRLKAKLDAMHRINIDPTMIESEILQVLDHISKWRPGDNS
jgi:phage terminase Nu1 subunit (DNA packaging protein)